MRNSKRVVVGALTVLCVIETQATLAFDDNAIPPHLLIRSNSTV